MGDALMLSGVLKLVVENHPDRRFNLVRRTAYQAILAGHPAIDMVGFPPKDARIITTDYWAGEELGGNTQRPFQILARMFGLATPVEERLYLPGEQASDGVLFKFIPWERQLVAILAPASDSPRKTLSPGKWSEVVDRLVDSGFFVVQVGRDNERHIRGAYSLIGLTSAHELVGLVESSNVVVCADNFVMHTAHLAGTPAVVTWGPTDPVVYGYQGQIHFRGSFLACPLKDECLGPKFPQNYGTECPRGGDRCVDAIAVEEIVRAVLSVSGAEVSAT
jgi:ADP-heptose:LPS heptosyltransferase